MAEKDYKDRAMNKKRRVVMLKHRHKRKKLAERRKTQVKPYKKQ